MLHSVSSVPQKELQAHSTMNEKEISSRETSQVMGEAREVPGYLGILEKQQATEIWLVLDRNTIPGTAGCELLVTPRDTDPKKT